MFLLLLLVLIFIFCFILLLKLLLPFSPHQRKRLPPGPPGVPIIGSIPFLPRTFRIKGRGLHTPKLFYYLAQKYGAVCHLWLGPVPTIVVSDTQILKKAFKNANMSSRPIMKPFHQFRYGTQVSFWCVTQHIVLHSEISKKSQIFFFWELRKGGRQYFI